MDILKMFKDRITGLYGKYIDKDKIENLEVFYISGSQMLPPPLTPAEEEELLGRLTQNDSNVRQTLVERNLRLVVYIAKKFENTRNWY